MLSEEVEYDNSIINLRGKKINTISLMIETSNLPDDIVWDKFFIYKYIENIKLYNDDGIIFSTNGLFMKSDIDLNRKDDQLFIIKQLDDKEILENLSQQCTLYYFSIYNKYHDFSDDNAKLDIQINTNLTVPEIDNAPIKLKIILENNERDILTQTNTFMPWCERIEIPNNVVEYKYHTDMQGILKYFLFYIDGDIKINNVLVLFNNYIQSYFFNNFNTMLPYIHLNKIPSDTNYLYIPFCLSNNPNSQSGLDLDIPTKVNIIFNFMENKGGQVYLLSEIKTQFPNNIKMDNWSTGKDNSENTIINIDVIRIDI